MNKEKAKTFEKELTELLNKYSFENESNTPDFILAEYLLNCLTIFNITIYNRKKWYSDNNHK